MRCKAMLLESVAVLLVSAAFGVQFASSAAKVTIDDTQVRNALAHGWVDWEADAAERQGADGQGEERAAGGNAGEEAQGGEGDVEGAGSESSSSSGEPVGKPPRIVITGDDVSPEDIDLLDPDDIGVIVIEKPGDETRITVVLILPDGRIVIHDTDRLILSAFAASRHAPGWLPPTAGGRAHGSTGAATGGTAGPGPAATPTYPASDFDPGVWDPNTVIEDGPAAGCGGDNT